MSEAEKKNIFSNVEVLINSLVKALEVLRET
jgi:hypothetical protein